MSAITLSIIWESNICILRCKYKNYKMTLCFVFKRFVDIWSVVKRICYASGIDYRPSRWSSGPHKFGVWKSVVKKQRVLLYLRTHLCTIIPPAYLANFHGQSSIGSIIDYLVTACPYSKRKIGNDFRIYSLTRYWRNFTGIKSTTSKTV